MTTPNNKNEKLATSLQAAIQKIAELESQLRNAESKLQQLSENNSRNLDIAKVILLELDQNARVKNIEGRCEEILGYQPSELIGIDWIECCIPTEERVFVREVFNDLMSGKIQKLEYYENEIQTRTGDRRLMIWHNTLITDATGKAIGTLSTGLDTTSRRQTEELLKQSEVRFRNIIEASPVPYALNDESGNITYLNSAFISTFGYDLTDIPTLSDWWPKAYPDKEYLNWVSTTWQKHLEKAKREGTSFEPLELSIRCKNGSYKTALVGASPLAEAYKDNHLVILYDITERKNMERTLADSETRFRTLVENVPGVSYRCKCDEHWTMEFISGEVEQLSGYPVSDFIGNKVRSYASIIYPEDVSHVDKCVMEGVKRKDIFTIEYRVLHASGEVKWVVEKGQAIFDSEGNIKWLDGVILDVTDNKRVEQLMRASEKKYRQLFENMTSGFALHEIICNDQDQPIDYRFLELNPAFEKLTGANASELVGKTIREVLPNTEDYWINHYGKVALTGEPAAFENYSQEFDRYYDTWAFSPDKNKFAVVFTDITNRKKAEQALREGDSHFRALFEQSSFGVAKINSESGQFVKVNPRYAQILGYSVDEMLQLDFQSITAPEDLQADLANMAKLRKGEVSTIQIEKRYHRKDGTIVWVNFSVMPLWQAGDRPDFYLAIVEDITKRKLAETRLQYQKDEQQQILHSMVDAVVTIDENSVIQTFNQAAVQMFGYESDEVIGQDVKILMPPDYASQHDGYLNSYLISGNPEILGVQREVSGRRRNGEIFPMRLSLGEIPRTTDGKRRFIGSCQDISSYKRQEELLRRSQKLDALGNLTGGIAHDYNNMLGVILGYAQLLQEELSDMPHLKKFADHITHASERGRKLSGKLLSFTRKKEPESRKVNISESIFAEKELLEKTLTPNISLVTKLDHDLWPVNLDESDLEDALLNLCINAAHAMESGGVLTITTANRSIDSRDSVNSIIESGDYVQVSVSDTGIGMDAETKSKMFDPFFTTKGDKGVGLGLSMVYAFVKRSGGEIEVHSKPGQGATFNIYIPRYFENIRAETDLRPATNPPPGGKETILVVDDEAALVELMKDTLSLKGYAVVTAKTADEALNILENQKVDLVISDVVMPDMDGYQLADRVKTLYPQIKLQLVSGYAASRNNNPDNRELRKSLLQKPFPTQLLLTRIREIFDAGIH